jgi:Lon protease-like protein
MTSSRLPMFPLGSVLIPHGVLPLHVFEPRYRVLMFDCLRAEREFGVVLIERGSEVGGEDQRFDVATVARVAEAVELPDGRWFVLAVGTRRVDVVEWLPDDPYPVALTRERAEVAWSDEAAAAFAVAEPAMRRVLTLAADLGEESAPASVELSSEPATAAWELLGVSPLGSLDKQRLLAVDDPVDRLVQLARLAEEYALLLAYRLERE